MAFFLFFHVETLCILAGHQAFQMCQHVTRVYNYEQLVMVYLSSLVARIVCISDLTSCRQSKLPQMYYWSDIAFIRPPAMSGHGFFRTCLEAMEVWLISFILVGNWLLKESTKTKELNLWLSVTCMKPTYVSLLHYYVTVWYYLYPSQAILQRIYWNCMAQAITKILSSKVLCLKAFNKNRC